MFLSFIIPVSVYKVATYSSYEVRTRNKYNCQPKCPNAGYWVINYSIFLKWIKSVKSCFQRAYI